MRRTVLARPARSNPQPLRGTPQGKAGAYPLRSGVTLLGGAAVNALGGPELTDRQLSRMAFRVSLFNRRGLELEQAERLADRLVLRDAEHDDRRCCIECSERTMERRCLVAERESDRPFKERTLGAGRFGLGVIDTVLARCAGFSFQRPA